ncbi:MAG TPA: AI-2E family transporter, partial [Pyrinomonadaceae bacterium]|nr:AI-2E family transporter [Pyrinomonadaceae bacterium]
MISQLDIGRKECDILMKPVPQQDRVMERPSSASLWDTLIRVSLIAGLAVLCYQVFSPFLRLLVWSIILAVTMYPVHQWLARRIGRRQGLTSVILALLGVAVIVVPTWLLMNSFADSVRGFVDAVQQNTLQIPPPRESVKNWPVVGRNIYDTWSQAGTDLPGLVQTMQPKIGELARVALSMVASIGGTMLLFLASFCIANIVMAYGESASRGSRAFFNRVAGPSRGEALVSLALATIKAVALGVIGVAAIQALLIG